MRVPSLTPAGILTLNRRVRRSRPEPRQFGHGSSMIVPFPRQRGHGEESAKRPCDSETTPRPPHCGQTIGAVPGFAPEPPQTWQLVSRLTGIVVSTPLSESSNERRDLDLDVRAALAARLPGARRRASRAAEQAAEQVAEVAELAEVERDALAARPEAAGRPASRACRTAFRFSGSERTS